MAVAAAALLLLDSALINTASADTYSKTRYPIVLVHGTFGFNKLGAVVNGIMQLVTTVYNGLLEMLNGKDLPRDPMGTLCSLSTPGAAEFNARFPAGVPTTACGQGDAVVDGVRYFSWSGTQPFNNYRDPADYAFALTARIFPTPNDGLVEQCGSHLGTVIRDNYRMNHLDEVNHFFGLVGMDNPSPKALFREHANRLKLQGL